MLSKEERNAIAERFISYDGNKLYFAELFKCLFGREVDLCDTSNMLELPLDKDGEVIHIGDTLFDNDGAKITVCSIRFNNSENNVVITCEDSEYNRIYADIGRSRNE